MGDRIVFNVKLLLDVGEDRDLIDALQSAPNRKRAALVKSMLRYGIVEQTEVIAVEDREITIALEGFLQ